MTTKRYIGHPWAPSFSYRESKRSKIRPESLAYYLMRDLILCIPEYEYMDDGDELIEGFFEYITAVYSELIQCIDHRGLFIYLQKSKFQEAANRIILYKPHNVYNIFYFVAKEVIDIILEARQDFHMKQRDLYFNHQSPR